MIDSILNFFIRLFGGYTKEEVETYIEDVEIYKEKVSELQDINEKNNNVISTLQSKIDEITVNYETQISDIKKENEETINDLNSQIESLKKEIEDLKAEPISGTATIVGDATPSDIKVYPTVEEAGEDNVKITVEGKIGYVSENDLKSAGIDLDGNEVK